MTAAFELGPETLVNEDGKHAQLLYCPLGVVGAIGPRNWSMMISTWQLALSLHTGNTIVMKPSEYTPLSVFTLAKVLHSVLPGDGEIGQRLSPTPGSTKSCSPDPPPPARRSSVPPQTPSTAGMMARATTATTRRQVITTPARVARRSRRLVLHLTEGWKWEAQWGRLFTHVHSLPVVVPALPPQLLSAAEVSLIHGTTRI